MNKLEAIKQGVVTIDHINLGLLILGGVAFLAIAILFIKHSKAFLINVSDSLKDPITGKWSPKICVSFMVSLCIFLAHLVWLKSSFIANDFSKLENILLIDYGYLSIAFGLRTVEKMQANKLDANKTTDEPIAKP